MDPASAIMRTAIKLAHAGEWEAAFAEMSDADQTGMIVTGDNLRDFATAAYMTGREDKYLDMMARAFEVYTDVNETHHRAFAMPCVNETQRRT
jgi:hypothetical protein